MNGQPIEDLLLRGTHLVHSNQASLALPYLEKAVELAPSNVSALNMLGEALVDLGDVERAKKIFQTSTKKNPDSPESWLFLAQMSIGTEALNYYKKACQILEAMGEQNTKEICHAKVAIAELYLTDLCMEPNAEQLCESAIAEAERWDSSSIEVAQTKASMRLSQCRPDEARDSVLYVASVLHDASMENREVPYEFCVQTGKLLLELGEVSQSLKVLEPLLQEDDENVELWILLGLCHKQSKEEEVAIECWERAQVLLEDFLRVDPHDELFQHQLAEVNELLKL